VSSEQPLPAIVVIPSRDRPELLRECVDSILGGSEVPREIVIVDQSGEENRELAEMGTVHGCRVVYHRVASRGVSAARNEGCALAGQDVLVFTDDDVIADRDWLGAMVRAVLDDPENTLISGRVLSVDRNGDGGFAPSLIADEEPRTYQGRVWSDVLFSNNMAFSRAVFDRLGPFDVRLGVGGPYRAATDNDYCFRALEAGYRIRYDPAAVVYHQAWRTSKHYARLRWGYGVGQGACFLKHSRLSDRYMLIRLRNAVVWHAREAVAAWRHDRQKARGEAAYALGLLYGASNWFLLERLPGR
jgi:GT2 family glycosyltransferase